MEQWLESVYSDGSAAFVSNPAPQLFETVTIRLRMYEDAPVQYVVLRATPNGGEWKVDMRKAYRENGFVYWECPLRMDENRMCYHFYIVSGEQIYFYNQKEITTYLPEHSYDFQLVADYVQPAWVKHAVFYQIFPERFCNGDPSNDVRTGEYSQDGYPCIRMESWDAKPLTYEEGHCLDFYGGDLQGIQQKIPYLKELGVTALYLNPIFYAQSCHKYDCLDYFHVDPHFGGDQALADLSKALHENGMKLILDISINHTGTAHRWFNRDGLYFDKNEGAYNNPDSVERSYYFFEPDNSYHGWWGLESMPTLNYTSDALREIVYRGADSVLKKWLKEPYSIDGWRFDVADVFARNGKVQLAHSLWPEIRKSIRQENEQAYILAEDWGDCAQYLQGSEWDSPMNYYGCGRVIRSFYGEPDLFMMRHPVLSKMRSTMSAEDLEHRVMQHLARMPYALWQNQFNLFDSHDTSRFHNNPAISASDFQGAALFQFLLTGAPSIYYGDEADIDGLYGTNEGCRYPMPWSKSFQEGEKYQLYHRLAHLKKEHPALSEGGMKFLYAHGDCFAIARFWGNDILVGVISKSDRQQVIRLPLGAVGGCAPEGERDLLGNPLFWEKADRHGISFHAAPHGNYLFRCRLTDKAE